MGSSSFSGRSVLRWGPAEAWRAREEDRCLYVDGCSFTLATVKRFDRGGARRRRSGDPNHLRWGGVRVSLARQQAALAVLEPLWAEETGHNWLRWPWFQPRPARQGTTGPKRLRLYCPARRRPTSRRSRWLSARRSWVITKRRSPSARRRSKTTTCFSLCFTGGFPISSPCAMILASRTSSRGSTPVGASDIRRV